MATSNELPSRRGDQRQDGRSGEPPPGVDVTRQGQREGLSREGHAARLSSDAELSRLANQLFATGPAGANVPTTGPQPGAHGAPHGRYPLERDSATTLGVSEEQRVYSLLHPQ